MAKNFLTFISIVVLFVFAISCAPEAPRSNPLDPALSGSENKTAISGKVFTKYQPVRPLNNSSVLLLPPGNIAMTDGNGSYSFENLSEGNYQLIAKKDNYQQDTIEVSIGNAEQKKDVNFFLNAIPEIKSIKYYSEHIDQWYPGEVYHAFLTVIVNDSDGVADIDSLIYSSPALNITRPFEATARPDSFFVDIDNFDLPEENLQHLVEQAAYVTVSDKSGATISGGPYFLRRIIDQAPLPLSPADLQTVSPFPALRWEALPLPFEFNYITQVFRITAGFPVLIHTSPDISSDQLSYNMPDSLSSGTYFWTIGVRDKLNNFSRSKEASFIVP